jgi:hypothetical protein
MRHVDAALMQPILDIPLMPGGWLVTTLTGSLRRS